MDELHRRAFIALLGAPLLIALLESCGDDEATAADVGSARSDESRSTAAATEAGASSTASNEFAMSLYRQLGEIDATGNVVIAPADIAIALTMLTAGARGATLDEMVKALQIADTDTIHQSMNALTTQLDAVNGDAVLLSAANSLWAPSDVVFVPQFLDLLAREYGAGMELVEGADAESARLAINQWASDRTRQRIDSLLEPDVLERDTKLVVVTANSLNAKWAQQFDVRQTTDAPFGTASGDVVRVPTMTLTTRLAFATGDGWRAVEVPYEQSSLAMVIFAPEDGFLPLFEQIFLVTDATEYLEPRHVRLQLPRFAIDSSFSLNAQLARLGMPTAFTESADFSGITADTDLHLSEVAHHASITVTEQGTGESTAVSATAAHEEAPAVPLDEPIDLVIDRPFVFVVRDTATEVVLFMGRVSDPRGNAVS